MKKLSALLVAITLLLVPSQAIPATKVIVQGEDEDGYKKTIRTDTEGRPEAVQAQLLLDACDATTGWTAFGDDTTGLAVDLDHVQGTKSLEFDKVDGTANTIFGGVQKTLTSVDIAQYMENNGFILVSMNLSALTDIAYCFVRLGTDASNYNEWRVDDDALGTGWNQIRYVFYVPDTAGNLGNGMLASAITYAAVGCAFDLETSALADIRVDNIAVNSGLQISADINSQVGSVPGAANVNVIKIGSQPVDIGAGNAGPGSLRISVSDDDTNLAAINADTTTIAGDTTAISGKLTSDNDAAELADYYDTTSQRQPYYVDDATLAQDNEPISDVMASIFELLEDVRLIATAANMAKTEDGLKVEAVMYGDDGITLDPVKLGPVGEIQVTDVVIRPGENASLGAREAKISYLGVTEPAKQGPTAVTDVAITAATGAIIFTSTKVLPNGRFCVYVKNTGGGSGDDFSDVEIHDSPDGTSGWVITNTWTSCDTLSPGAALCKYCSDDAVGWFLVKARCVGTEDTEAEVWLKQVKR